MRAHVSFSRLRDRGAVGAEAPGVLGATTEHGRVGVAHKAPATLAGHTHELADAAHGDGRVVAGVAQHSAHERDRRRRVREEHRAARERVLERGHERLGARTARGCVLKARGARPQRRPRSICVHTTAETRVDRCGRARQLREGCCAERAELGLGQARLDAQVKAQGACGRCCGLEGAQVRRAQHALGALARGECGKEARHLLRLLGPVRTQRCVVQVRRLLLPPWVHKVLTLSMSHNEQSLHLSFRFFHKKCSKKKTEKKRKRENDESLTSSDFKLHDVPLMMLEHVLKNNNGGDDDDDGDDDEERTNKRKKEQTNNE